MNYWFICVSCVGYFDIIVFVVSWFCLIVYDIFGIGYVTFIFTSIKCGLLVICAYFSLVLWLVMFFELVYSLLCL